MKKAFTLVELLGVIIVLAVISLIVFPIVDKSIKTSKEDSLNSIIKTIEKAAQEYVVREHMGYTTSYDKVDIDELIATGYLKDNIINPVTNEKMNGCVIYKWQDEYNQYQFKYDEECNVPNLITTLLKQYSKDNKNGLVRDEENENLYYYTGTTEQVNNNFLWYGGHQWRVLEFDTFANTLTLITQQPLTAIQPTNASWNTQEEYKTSYINTWLNDYFYNSLDSDIQENILDNTFNIGIYNNVSLITTTKKVGLLDQSQYERAGGANSFLDIKDCWWLGNIVNSSRMLLVANNGNFDYYSMSNNFGVRAIIKISDLNVMGGDGTLVNNYRIANKAANMDNVEVGEYINIPYSGNDNACGSDNICTFRVVNKGSNNVKVVLNGLLSNESTWADNASDNIQTTDAIYVNVLNPFIENIDSKYKTTGLFGVEIYITGDSYVKASLKKVTANVGLPTIGEMFSGNDIDLSTSSTKTFVDTNTIENSAVSNYYWTMNRYNSGSVHVNDNVGFLYPYSPTDSYGVRPVIYLKNNLEFTGGEGTAQSPYTLE